MCLLSPRESGGVSEMRNEPLLAVVMKNVSENRDGIKGGLALCVI